MKRILMALFSSCFALFLCISRVIGQNELVLIAMSLVKY